MDTTRRAEGRGLGSGGRARLVKFGAAAAWGVGLLGVLMVALPGCSERGTASRAPAVGSFEVTTPEGPADQTYTTRGRIETLPWESLDRTLHIYHETIPDFLNSRGEVVGMKAHNMAFGWIGPGVPLAEFKTGDIVELTFEVRWQSKPRSLVTGLKKLPADTVLNLSRESAPPADSGGAQGGGSAGGSPASGTP